jgi:hypothetical protein
LAAPFLASFASFDLGDAGGALEAQLVGPLVALSGIDRVLDVAEALVAARGRQHAVLLGLSGGGERQEGDQAGENERRAHVRVSSADVVPGFR